MKKKGFANKNCCRVPWVSPEPFEANEPLFSAMQPAGSRPVLVILSSNTATGTYVRKGKERKGRERKKGE